MKELTEEKRLLYIIRGLVVFFILALCGAGITAFPVETELKILCKVLNISLDTPEAYLGLYGWFVTVANGLVETNANYPFFAYGYDWLAFSHIVIAVAFIGLYIKPIRNKWIIYFGMIACVGVIPLAFICGAIRGIPFYWQLIDCSFGVFGMFPLLFLHKCVKKLEILVGGYPDTKY